MKRGARPHIRTAMRTNDFAWRIWRITAGLSHSRPRSTWKLSWEGNEIHQEPRTRPGRLLSSGCRQFDGIVRRFLREERDGVDEPHHLRRIVIAIGG